MKVLHIRWYVVCLITILGTQKKIYSQSFIHPGILHGQNDLSRMKEAVSQKVEPIYSGYLVFKTDPASQFNYTMEGPMASVGRNPTVGASVYDNDANAAHQNAIMWTITGDKRYADKAIKIVNEWSAKLTSVTGKDAVLMAGLGPFKMVNAAELIRYTNTGWSDADISKTERHFKEVIYPVLKDYAPFANGNWDAAALKTAMAIGVFCNDRSIFEDALRYYMNGGGNGNISHYIISNEGQIQESGRDQPHSQLGIGMLAECCAIAWNQGLDLYGYLANRLLKGFEYTAKYNLGHDDIPFIEWLDRTGKYHHRSVSAFGRGNLRPLFEQVYAHYHGVKKLETPYVKRVVDKIRPEKSGKPGADHPGYGTLFFALPSGTDHQKLPDFLAPGGLVALGYPQKIVLSWVGVASQEPVKYIIKRADGPDKKFRVIADHIEQNYFIDQNVKPGKLYVYTVSAKQLNVESNNAYQQSAYSGLPGKWRQADMGQLYRGNSFFDGKQLNLEGYGKGIGASGDSLHYTYLPVAQDGSLEMRILEQPSSQFSSIGIMLRSDTTSNANFAAITLYPGKTSNIEMPDWHTRFELRKGRGEAEVIGREVVLDQRAATFGRLTGTYWLKMVKKRQNIEVYTSYDGINWTQTGSKKMNNDTRTSYIGITVASGINNSTNVRVDNVKLNGRNL